MEKPDPVLTGNPPGVWGVNDELLATRGGDTSELLVLWMQARPVSNRYQNCQVVGFAYSVVAGVRLGDSSDRIGDHGATPRTRGVYEGAVRLAASA